MAERMTASGQKDEESAAQGEDVAGCRLPSRLGDQFGRQKKWRLQSAEVGTASRCPPHVAHASFRMISQVAQKHALDE